MRWEVWQLVFTHVYYCYNVGYVWCALFYYTDGGCHDAGMFGGGLCVRGEVVQRCVSVGRTTLCVCAYVGSGGAARSCGGMCVVGWGGGAGDSQNGLESRVVEIETR